MKFKPFSLFVITSMFLLFIICRFVLFIEQPWKPNGQKGLVTRIIDGRTVEFKDGLMVQLLGVKGSEASKSFLENNVLGKNVVIIRDGGSGTPHERYDRKPKSIQSYLYLKTDNGWQSITILLLQNGLCNPDFTNCSKDSLFTNPYPGCPPPPNQETIKNMIKLATFKIIHFDGSTSIGIFLDKHGLAVTNDTLLFHNDMECVCILPDEKGGFNYDDHKCVDRFYYVSNKNINLTLFKVHLDVNEQVSFLPLLGKKANEGEQIFTLTYPNNSNTKLESGKIINTYTLDDDYGKDNFIYIHTCKMNANSGTIVFVDMWGRIVGISQNVETESKIARLYNIPMKDFSIALDVSSIYKLVEQFH